MSDPVAALAAILTEKNLCDGYMETDTEAAEALIAILATMGWTLTRKEPETGVR